MRVLSAWALLSSFAPLTAAPAQTTSTSTPGYNVERSQSVQNAPAGFVGRKTTDRERRVGNADSTRANETTHVLTYGGFVRRCPTSAGIVKGDFEYAITYNGTRSDGGRESQTRRLIVQLEGHVGDNAKLTYVDMTGDFTVDISGTDVTPTSERRPVKTRFTPGAHGEGDIPAMTVAVEMTADIAAASAVLSAGMLYRVAEGEWSKLNECVELTFDPPTDTQKLGPHESTRVRVGVRAKEDGVPVPWTSESINAIEGIGTASPRAVPVAAADGAPVTLTYTATAQPRRGNGLDVNAGSRAGVGRGLWTILDFTRYEGTFTQTGTMSLGGSAYGMGASQNPEITGRLVWTPDTSGTRQRTFGDVASTVYVPTDGEVSVQLRGEGTSMAGACTYKGEKTFKIRDLPPAALQHLQLEVAHDGRYKMMLGMISHYLQFQVEMRCKVPIARKEQRMVQTYDAAIGLGQLNGVLTNEIVTGETTEPVVSGPFRYTGRWEFKPLERRP